MDQLSQDVSLRHLRRDRAGPSRPELSWRDARQWNVSCRRRAVRQIHRLLWPTQDDSSPAARFADGTTSHIVSNDAWRVASGPITFSCIFGGEDYDARLERSGWDQPGFNDAGWQAAMVVDGPGGQLVAQSAPPIKVIETFVSKSVSEPAPAYSSTTWARTFPAGRSYRSAGRPGRRSKSLRPKCSTNRVSPISEARALPPTFPTHSRAKGSKPGIRGLAITGFVSFRSRGGSRG